MADRQAPQQKELSTEDRLKAMEEALAAEKAKREAAEARQVAAEAAAKSAIASAEQRVKEATSPGVAPNIKVTAQSKDDIPVLCMKTCLFVRFGPRTYIFKEDEEIMMDPSHAKEAAQSGWVKVLKASRR